MLIHLLPPQESSWIFILRVLSPFKQVMQLRVKALRRLLFIHAGEVCARELVALEASGRASSVRHRQSGVHE